MTIECITTTASMAIGQTETDEADLAALLALQELPPWGSGELVSPFYHAIVSGDERYLPVNIPNTGQEDPILDESSPPIRAGEMENDIG